MTTGNIPVPTPATLAKYGLDEPAWRALGAVQGWRCPVCQRRPPEVRLVIDHEHVKGYRQMPAAERRLYVRGLLCVRCNYRFVPQGVTGEIAQRIATYLDGYAARRASQRAPEP